MMLGTSAWRTNDAVRCNLAREVLNSATAKLFEAAERGELDIDAAATQAASLRLELLAIDGFDRQAIDGFVNEVNIRVGRHMVDQS